MNSILRLYTKKEKRSLLTFSVETLSMQSHLKGQELKEEQENDPFIKALKAYLQHKELSKDHQCERLVIHVSLECFLEDDVLWKRIKRPHKPSRILLFLPTTMIPAVIADAHGELLLLLARH